ncbi:MAG: ATP-dependent zinc metalloprotease FtsH [Ruminococcaceae bacterium]|nr:ATP-dependent zinc metalloprotease FtsH [Oscillospiraceae bacterium]
MKVFKNLSFYIVIIAVIIIAAIMIRSVAGAESMYYSELVEQIQAGNVKSIVLSDDKATVKLKADAVTQRENDKGETKEKTLKADSVFEVKIIAADEFQTYITSVLEASVEGSEPFKFTNKVTTVPFWVSLIPYVLMFVIFAFFLFIFLGQNSGGSGKIMNFGRSRAKMHTTSTIKFEDVAGADEEKEEMAELVNFLKDPRKYTNLGARIPKGVLMVGPPGTGKTYLAKAIAGEAGVPFFSISGSDFVEMYVGVGASRVRDMFEQAKKNSPCIIFIDEIDAVGRHRGSGLGGGHDEREQTLNQLLVEMDGFSKYESIIVIAATNRPDILDPALTRPGRFDRKITVGYPDMRARELMLGVHAKNKPLAEDVSLLDVAKNTVGFTAADLENLMNESALLAARDDSDVITNDHIKEATFRVIVGPEKRSRVMTEPEKKLTAYHEAGHAIAVKLSGSNKRVDRISIIPAGSAGGYTASRADEDTSYMTKTQLISEIVVSLGGKAAEEIVLGEVSTGASADLKQANSIAMNMVTKYGMSDAVGNRILDQGSDEVFLGRDYGHRSSVSESLASVVDAEVKKIIDSAYDDAKRILTENIDKLHAVAQKLIELEKLEGDEFEAIMSAE